MKADAAAQFIKKCPRKNQSPEALLNHVLEQARENPETHFVELSWSNKFPNEKPWLEVRFPDGSSAEFQVTGITWA